MVADRRQTAHHPWRGDGVPTPIRPVETARTCRKCGQTKPLARPHFKLRQGRWFERVCQECRDRGRPRNGNRVRERVNTADRARARRALLAVGYTFAPRSWWSVVHAACELGLSRRRVCDLICAGELRAMRDGRRTWKIDPASVRERISASVSRRSM